MLSYLAFIHHGIKSIGNPLSDGKTLAQACVKQLKALNDPKQFPPRLLILLASPVYMESLKSEHLLNGVLHVFNEEGYPDVELMGCSVAAVFFNRHIHPEGALLVCLASRLLKARVGAGTDASHNPEKAVKTLLHRLDLHTEGGKEIHSFANRTLFTLFPGFDGYKYLAPELHEKLRDQLGPRISIFGGVASANDPQRIRPGILFANRKVYSNAIVAASVECGTPFGMSLTQGLTDTGHTLNVAELDPEDRRIIKKFSDGDMGGDMDGVMQRLGKMSPVPLFSSLALDRDPTVDTPTFEGGVVRLTREVRDHEPFRLLIPKPGKMRMTFRDGVNQSMEKAWLLNPIAGLGFRCTGLLRHGGQIGLDVEHDSALIEHDLSLRGNHCEKPFVGGFVDGEAGVDKNGKSVSGNWSNATLIFGDELRFRTPVYRGFEKLAEFAAMKVAGDHKEGVDRLTQLVYDIGFPGAMLSFCMRDQDRYAIVGQSFSGSRYELLLNEVKAYPLDGDDILAIVAREKQARPVIDTRNEKCGSMEAAGEQGIISQYILPLTGISGDVSALLQIDLGDISYDKQLYQTEKFVLNALGDIVNSGLNRAFNWAESRIIRRLDEAMSECLSAETLKQGLQQYLEQALKAFGLSQGHIRIAHKDRHSLGLIAGVGDYFQESRKKRAEIDFGDLSPTAQAFRDEKTTVINDAKNNKAHQKMCKRYKGELRRRLEEVGSYANVFFKSERGEGGTINLVSSEPWVFTSFHETALKALGERVAFLLETLRRKERESFLLGVSPQLSRIRDLSQVSSILADEIERFAKTVKAEIASLYLWEEDRQLYILRAEYGWDKPEWVNAARYSKDDFWTGTSALAGVPRHIPDLYKYYRSNHYPKSARLYTKAAFGKDLSRDFTVEAIGLQLRIAKERIGVLTFYRRIEPGAESGFPLTDTGLLQQGADNFTGLISILQSKRREAREKKELARRQDVYDATITTSDEEITNFEPRVCLQVLKSYNAIKTAFYKVVLVDGTPQVTHKISFSSDGQAGQVPLKEAADPLVQSTAQANRYNEREIKIERVKLEGDEWNDPERVAVAELVRRACIPLFSEKQPIGILDVHWALDDKTPDSLEYQYDHGFLRMVGEVVGSAYGRNETKRQAQIKLQEGQEKLDQGETKLLESKEISRNAFDITTAHVLQNQHELRNMFQEMTASLCSLQSALSKGVEEESRQLIEELLLHEREISYTLSKMIDIGSRVIAPASEILTVKSLIRAVLEKEHNKCKKLKIVIDPPDVLGAPSIWADRVLMGCALSNLVDNAANAMIGREKRVLSTSARENAEAGTVIITIKDTGEGMSQAKIEQVLRRFIPSNGRPSAGITITKLILAIFGGTLDYPSSIEGVGTETRVTLPLCHQENIL